MVASNRTIENVISVVSRHVDEKTLEKIFDELLTVRGNKSFEDSIKRCREEVLRVRTRSDKP
jgi:hypothetical protein